MYETVRQGMTSVPARSLAVEVTDGADAGARATGTDVTIGTAEGSTLRLRDPAVSRFHAELRPVAGGVAVIDHGSTNGTYVGAVRIERAVVPLGSVLRVGDTSLRVADGSVVEVELAAGDAVGGVIGSSPVMRRLLAQVERAAQSDVSVLVTGESGTGKELVARALHDLGPRRSGPFVTVDCGSLPPTLVASELFGHERGAFTGADRAHVGAFEAAHGGTLFLDEIGELPLEVQPALLGVLERRAFTRVGGASPISVDVRILAATHRDLRAEVNAGRFRADLYYRLAVAKIVIPPLRERPEDIEPLARHFVQKLTGSDDLGPLTAALPALRAHPWSGNVRELRNVVEAAIVMGELDLGGERAAPLPAPSGGTITPYRDARAAALSRFEAEYLRDLIERTGGNASEAARVARMDRPYLLTLLRKHGLRS